MEFELAEEYRMLPALVANFVADHLLPLVPAVLASQAAAMKTNAVSDGDD